MNRVLTFTLSAVIAIAASILAVPSSMAAQDGIAYDTRSTSLLSRSARLDVSDVTVEEALTLLRHRSQVDIVFSPTLLPTGRVSCACADVTVAQALDQLLKGTGFSYFEMPLQVVIQYAGALPPPPNPGLARTSSAFMLVNAVNDSGRDETVRFTPITRRLLGTINGRVVDAMTQTPLATVQIHIPALEIGVLTNSAGFFSLPNVPAGTHTLVAEVIGYQRASQEVTVVDDSTVIVNFELVQTAVALEEVVAVGYGTQARELVSGSVSSVSSAEIERSSATTSAAALVGKIQGINTRMPSNTRLGDSREARDGRPGGSIMLQIRNMGEPLYVIDGVPVDARDFNHLNFADIEEISILKDASASVYGFRASNGVVLIRTKRGAMAQRPQLRVNGYYGWQWLHRHSLPHGFGNTAYQHMYAIVESEQNLGQARTIDRDDLEQWLYAPTYEHFPLTVSNQGALQANVNAALSGGTADANYYLSVGHVVQEYVLPDNKFQRTNLQANLRSELFDGFSIGTELRGYLEAHDLVASGASADPVQGIFRAIISSWPHEDPWANGNRNYVAGGNRYLIRSPAVMNQRIGGTQDQYRQNVAGNLWAEYRLPYGFTLKGTISHRRIYHQYDYHGYDIEAYCYDAETDTYYVCETVTARDRQHSRELDKSDFSQIQLTHPGVFLGRHSLSGTIAYERTGGESERTELRSTPPTTFNSLIDLAEVNNLANTWSISRRASFIGRLNYDFDRKYLVEVLGRYDGSYLYAPGHRWGFFPGVSLAWRVTQEDFVRDRFSFLNELKIRTSWGRTGREQASPWSYLAGATYGVGGGSVFDGALKTGVRPRNLPNTKLSWVTSTARNIGIEAAVFDQRLSIEFDVFERKLSGLPASRYDVLLPSEVGYSLPQENLESESIRGLEFMIRYTDRIGNVTVSISPNATLARRKILDRYKPRYGNSWHRYRTASEHRWAGIRFDYQVIGQFQSVEEIENYPVDHDGQGNRTLLPGDWIFKDVNGDNLIDELDMRPIGWPEGQPPILSYGMGTSLAYGNITLNVDLAGGTMFSYLPMNDVRLAFNTDHASGAYYQSRWRRADPYDDQSEWIPGRWPPLRKLATSHSSNRTSDKTFLNVTYLRLRRVELGYNLPSRIAERLSLANARIYASSDNPWWIDNQRHWQMDPEASVANVYPSSSVFTIGFSATLGGGTTQAVATDN